MFERFTDPITVVRTVLAQDMNKLRKLIDGGARIDRRTAYDPWMTPLDAACFTKQTEAVEVLLDAGAPIVGSAIYEAIKLDFVAGLHVMHRREGKFHERFRQEPEGRCNPRLNRWLLEFTALDFALSIHSSLSADFLQSISARRHDRIEPHLPTCSAVFIEEESFASVGRVNVDGLFEVTSGFYCARCDRFVKAAS